MTVTEINLDAEVEEEVEAPTYTRTERLATWVFVLAFFIVNVIVGSSGGPHGHTLNSRDVEAVILGLFILGTIVFRSKLPRMAVERLTGVVAVFGILSGGYLLFITTYPYGTPVRYLETYALFSATYIVVAGYGLFFYRQDLLIEVFWKVSLWAMGLAIFGYVVTQAGFRFLTLGETGGNRLQGTLAEPSSWAPVVAAVLLLSLRRKEWRPIVLCAVVAVLSGSATVLIVVAISWPVYLALTSKVTGRTLLMVLLAVVVPLGLNFLTTANAASYSARSDQIDQTLGKLISGVQNIATNGAQGANPRFASVGLTEYELSAHDRTDTGYGPGAVSVYWPAEYPATTASSFAPRPNSLWLEIWFDFGVYGLVVFGALLVVAVWRMRRYPASMALFLPFMVASMVNSTGPELYKWTFLALFLFGFNWAKARTRPPASPSANQSAPAGTSLRI